MSNIKFNRTNKGIIIVPSETVLDKEISLGALGALTLLLAANEYEELYTDKFGVVKEEFHSVLGELYIAGYVDIEGEEANLVFNLDGTKLEEVDNE